MNNFCENCGGKIEKNSKFCSVCGKKVIYDEGLKKNNIPKSVFVIVGVFIFICILNLAYDVQNKNNSLSTEKTNGVYKRNTTSEITTTIVSSSAHNESNKTSSVTTNSTVNRNSSTKRTTTTAQSVKSTTSNVTSTTQKVVTTSTSTQGAVNVSKQNAVRKAKEYLNYTAFSKSGLIKQLQYEKFSKEDSEYAVEHCGADWNQQAVKKANQYLKYMAFSRDGLIDQLEYEGFTHSQAVYAVNQVGL